MNDDTFKEWMKTEIGEIKSHIHSLDKQVQANTDTLNKYLWMWRAIRWTVGGSLILVASNWESFLRFVVRG